MATEDYRYTLESMKAAFEAGAERAVYEEGPSTAERAPDFQEFMTLRYNEKFTKSYMCDYMAKEYSAPGHLVFDALTLADAMKKFLEATNNLELLYMHVGVVK